MPYINQERRAQLPPEGIGSPTTPGELNYLLTQVVINYLGQDLCYERINDVIGALEACKLEFYRRIATPYESQKIFHNGDVGYERWYIE